MTSIKKFINVVNENTSGAFASVSMPIGKTIEREQEDPTTIAPKVLEYGMWENSALTTTNKLKKKRGDTKIVKSVYGESKIVKESSQQSVDVKEDTLDENDLIINPSSISKLSQELVSKQQDRRDHEVSMALSDLYQAGKNAATVFALLKHVSEDEGIEGWVQEKIIKAADYLNTVREYLEGRQAAIDEESNSGLWANIHAKRERIKAGSGERMRKPGSKGAPSAQNFKDAAKTSK